MNKPSSNKLVPFLALVAALVIPALLPQSAHGMYDPKHGRWLQRDPAGVTVRASRSRLNPPQQYIDSRHLQEYVQSRPVSLLDPSGEWGYNIHELETERWAEMEEIRPVAAMWVARSDNETDGGPMMGGTGPMPYGEASRHFDRNPSGADSRLGWVGQEFGLALVECISNNDPGAAATHLGRSLHSMQDWWAHGSFWSAKGKPGPADGFHSGEYDSRNLDAVGTAYGETAPADGRAPQVFIEEPRPHVNPQPNNYYRKEVTWPHWAPLRQRERGTEESSRHLIRLFLATIRARCGSGTKCRACLCRFDRRLVPPAPWSRYHPPHD